MPRYMVLHYILETIFIIGIQQIEMGLMLGMDCLDKLVLTNYKQITCEYKFLDRLIESAIDSANYVYAYRKHAHNLQTNSTITWIDGFSKKFDFVEYQIPKINYIEKILPLNNEKVHCMELDTNNKKDFKESFLLSTRDVVQRMTCFNEKIFVDDPIYDQYDYIFTLNKQIIMMIDTHCLNIIIDMEAVNET